MGERDGGKYVAEAGIVAASMGYEKLATTYAEKAGRRRDHKGAKAIYQILEDRREIKTAKPEKQEQQQAEAA